MKKKKIQKENQESECLTVPRLSALASWLVYVWRIRVTGSPTYATRSVTLILTVSIGWQETFTEVDSQIFISSIKQPAAARPQVLSLVHSQQRISAFSHEKPTNIFWNLDFMQCSYFFHLVYRCMQHWKALHNTVHNIFV